ncbi:hypothetical protein ACWGH2_05270 [Streptomyces sp. NPDC054871]
MQFELVKCVTQVALVEDEGAVQEFVAAGLDPAFHDRVHARYPDAGAHDLDAGVAQDFVEEGGYFVSRFRMRRVACSMTARMSWRWPVKVTVSMKSQAIRASAWERRKSAQVVAARSGAGSMPSEVRISQMVVRRF